MTTTGHCRFLENITQTGINSVFYFALLFSEADIHILCGSQYVQQQDVVCGSGSKINYSADIHRHD